MKLTINPEYVDAPYQLSFITADGRVLDIDHIEHALRFRRSDLQTVLTALRNMDNVTVSRMAIRKYLVVEE